MTFPIVGVGASAGGMGAISELLLALGEAPGVAVVIIQHLDPTHESTLASLFGKATSLPVSLATDGQRVEPNCVYVLPANADLLIQRGRLQLTPRAETGGMHLPIDRFFTALAADRGKDAVGVVLTGGGSDGSVGIMAIKRAGGRTFAQDATATFHNMPDNAAATGDVDWVLSIPKIAAALRRADPAEPRDAEVLERVLSELSRASGIDFSSYKRSTLERRVQRRVVANGCASMGEYLELLGRSREEMQALSEEVLIHVTRFFRDPEVFDALKQVVLPALVANRARGDDIRVWVPGCASGEEVYSLAICALEFFDTLPSPFPLKLFGTDISSSAIAASRSGLYPASVERDLSQGRLQRFFVKTEAGYQIRKDVRDLCVFAQQDATRDPPFARIDLVSCRNLMIYLGPSLQERLLPVFHYALKTPGFLVLGSAETTHAFPGFAACAGKHKIFARTTATPTRPFELLPARHADTPPMMQAPPAAADVQREVDRRLLAEFAPPALVTTDDLTIVQFRGGVGPFLGPAPGAPSFDLMHMVREDLRLTLRQAIEEARRAATTVRMAVLQTEVAVIPFRVPPNMRDHFIVLFREQAPIAPRAKIEVADQENALALELTSTRDFLQSAVEQLEASNEELKAANEEVVSSNEELRSTNEELQMAKEELQATNQELATVNDELSVRNSDANRLNDDLTNVLSSVEIAIVLLGRDARVRRFTPAAARMFHLRAKDIGQPLPALGELLSGPDLELLVAQALERLTSVERALQDSSGRWFQLTARPYITLDSRIDGAVLVAHDVDAAKKAADRLEAAERYAGSIVDTVRDALVVIGPDQRIRSANRAFHQLFGVSKAECEGRELEELGGGEWRDPTLRERLRALGDNDKIDGYRVEQPLEHSGHRILMINARRIERTSDSLLAIVDVTDKERIAHSLREYQARLQQMAFDAALVEERERRRIAADLHDRIGQSLALAQIKLSASRESLSDAPRRAIDESIALLAQSIADTRGLIFELSPPVLYDLGLKEAIAWLAEDLETRYGVHIGVKDDGSDKPLSEGNASLVFRAVRELLTNVIKHAKTTQATVSLHREDATLVIGVIDEGVGFEVNDPRVQSGGYGLFSVREQLSRLGGTVKVHSVPGTGTQVSLMVPLENEA